MWGIIMMLVMIHVLIDMELVLRKTELALGKAYNI